MTVFAGLCATCRHMRPIRSRTGSVFRLCLLSTEDPRFEKYPKLPVLQCPGYAEKDPGQGGEADSGGGRGGDSREEDGCGATGSIGAGSTDESSPESEPGTRRGDSEQVRPAFGSTCTSEFAFFRRTCRTR